MSVYIGESRISRKNFFGRASLTTLDVAWSNIQPLLGDPSLEGGAKIVLCQWRGDQTVRRFQDWGSLTDALKRDLAAILGSGRRQNYFYQLEGENLNIDTVIFASSVPTSSIGWTQTEFFQQLGHPCNTPWPLDTDTSARLADYLKTDFIYRDGNIVSKVRRALKRRAEQEYLLMNMVKGAMFDAAEVADEFNVGIAVRGTGLLAHMAIEAGDPTKAQEYKNKTSKESDLILCEEMDWSQLGTVVHYDPRVEWSSQQAEIQAGLGKSPMFSRAANEADWQKKKLRIPARMAKLGPRVRQPSDKDLRDAFMGRSKEYMEEDHDYRKGHYAIHTTLVGPYIRLKLRPDASMIGDHDLFAFTQGTWKDYGVFIPDTDPRAAMAQKALQHKETFQAQHGGIWYWRPTKRFNVGIKNKIMSTHGPEKGEEPLVYIRPGKQVTAAFYLTHEDKLESVWAGNRTKWMTKTHSGQLFLNPVSLSGDD